jgi:hypothetical protein
MPTPFQPTLPAEGEFTEAELNFMEESPPGLFPENQDSNFGLIIRKIFTDQMQLVADQQTTLYNERFVDTSEEFLDEHERSYGLPVAPVGRTLQERRTDVMLRIQVGPFTRTRRQMIVEQFITATFGNPLQLTPDGIPLVAGGVPLFSEASSLTGLYAIVEDIPDFSYEVRIKDTVTPDVVGLTRELNRITPAGISFTVVSVPVP